MQCLWCDAELQQRGGGNIAIHFVCPNGCGVMKVCVKCETLKPLAEYYRRPDSPDGLRTDCKACRRSAKNKYYQENREMCIEKQRIFMLENKERLAGEIKKWKKTGRERNKDKIKAYNYRYTQEHKEEIRLRKKIYLDTRRPIEREQQRKRAARLRKESPKFRIRDNIGKSLRRSLKDGKKGKKLKEILGYTIAELKAHLEERFTDGMSWENYGLYGWHIDHIKPVAAFNYSSTEDEEFKQCWALENLQPLWAKDNFKKGAKWDDESVESERTRGDA